MATPTFRFVCDAPGGDAFTVTRFSGTQALSRLYRYEIGLKAPVDAGRDLEQLLDADAMARLVTLVDGMEYPVNGMLASLEENQTVEGYTYYTALLVPRVWKLTTCRTNEIYTTERTVDEVMTNVLENAGFASGYDFNLSGLSGSFLEKDYICQFRESDFDFISRLMENEGIYFYFQQQEDSEVMIVANGPAYYPLAQPDLIFDANPSSEQRQSHVFAWSCRKQRIPQEVTVRDYNPNQPSMDVAGRFAVDARGYGTEYLYGDHFADETEADYLAEIRAEEFSCRKTRYYGESTAVQLQPGFSINLDRHPNTLYNEKQYLLVEVNHEARGLDDHTLSAAGGGPGYRNSFVALDADVQYRPPLITPKPRFFGTMTAFVYAESATGMAEVDEQGRYRVHLPFDRAEGTMYSDDPNRKASHWIRMAQPYVGEDEGSYFPLKGNTEVLLTFINGDPDRPIISGAVPNASTPSIFNSETADTAAIHTPDAFSLRTGPRHLVSKKRDALTNQSAGAAVVVPPINAEGSYTAYLDPSALSTGPAVSMLPPFDGDPVKISFGNYTPHDATEATVQPAQAADDPLTVTIDESIQQDFSSDRDAVDGYGYANRRNFAYSQHERVYFIGSFHEDFHMRDGFTDPARSWTGFSEVFHFPAPGGDGTQIDPTTQKQKTEAEINPLGIRGLTEDRRWGDQMNFAWGRAFNWAGGPAMGTGGSQAVYNYGNSYTENLLTEMGKTADDIEEYRDHWGKWDYNTGWKPPITGGLAGYVSFVNKGIKVAVDIFQLAATQYAGSWGIPSFTVERGTLATATSLDPKITAVEKTFGHTYSYQMGLAVDIHEGNTIARTHGDSEEMIEGDSETVVWGDSFETVMGVSSAVFVGATSDLRLSADSTIQLGLKGDLFLGGCLDFNLALGLEYAPLMVDLKEAKTESSKVKAEVGAVKVGSKQVEVGSETVKIKNEPTAIKKGTVAMRVRDLEVAIATGVSVEQVNGLKVG